MESFQNNEITVRAFAAKHGKTAAVVRIWINKYPDWAKASGIRLIPAPRPYYVIRADAEPLKLHRGRPRKPDHSPATHLNSDGDSLKVGVESADLLENHTTK